MSKLTFLGVWMTPDVGETVSFAFDIGSKNKVLVDCGTNLVGSLIKNGIDPSEITHLIITHSHGDHISGLPTYLFYRLLIEPGILKKTLQPLQIIGTKNTIENVKKYIRASYGNMVDNSFLRFVEIKANDIYSIDNITFQFFQTKHQPETIGFCVNVCGRKIVYSSDTGISYDIMSCAENADILIHDVVGTSEYSMLSNSHTLCNEISPLLAKYNIKNFYPVHRLSIYKDDIKKYREELERNYQGNIIIPNDGDAIFLE